MRWFQATRSASFRASVARSAECLIELPCSREISCPSPDNAPASLRSASRYGLGSGEIEPLPIVDVDKSFLQTRLLPTRRKQRRGAGWVRLIRDWQTNRSVAFTAGFVKEQLTGPLIDGGNNSEDGRR
jgi:hypothetical protein